MHQDTAALSAFEEHRTLLFGIAYRMLGSVAEAEDILQEAFLRWRQQAVNEIQSPKAWLTAAVTRLCIDFLRSARKRREEYVGVWLPEPLLASPASPLPDTGALADSLTAAFLVMLETLSPDERAVFLLREVFEYDYSEISRIVGKSEANCRQMVRRAREHIAEGRPRFDASPAQGEGLVQQFFRACREGDTAGLLAMLSGDAVLYSDGGGKVPAAPAPIAGADRIARFLVGVSKIGKDSVAVRFAIVNSAPSLLIFRDGELVQTTSLLTRQGRIEAIYIVRNPDKLQRLLPASPQSPREELAASQEDAQVEP